MTLAGVAIAGALGALTRYGVGLLVGERSAGAFPWATLIVNVSGSLALGALAVALSGRLGVSPAVRTAVTVGFLGAYTTYSTFSLETVRLIEEGAVATAVIYVVVSVFAGLLAAWIGLTAARA